MPEDKGQTMSRRDVVKATGVGALATALGTEIVMAGRANAQPAEARARSTLAFAQSQEMDLSPDDAGGILPLLGELDIYPDITPGLQKLKEFGFQLVPHTQLSNQILERALLDRFEWDRHFTSESFALYKPQRARAPRPRPAAPCGLKPESLSLSRLLPFRSRLLVTTGGDNRAFSVAVTLARLKLPQVPRFIRWGRPVERQVRDDPGQTLAVAAASPPRTVSTFTVWRTAQAMTDMVRGQANVPDRTRHAAAMAERERKDFHLEFTTLRFRCLSEHGSWQGRTSIVPTTGR
jgi:hypothetical protein